MPWPGLHPRRRRRSLALGCAAAVAGLLAPACAEEREPAEACIDCGIHPDGILDPESVDFHGAELVRRDWDFDLCATCHGSDFGGGASGSSCLDCHDEGPTACGTCHEERPATASHPAHLGAGPAGIAWPCAECHEVPERWDHEGHILRGGAADPAPAEVVFGSVASQTPSFASRSAPPSYSAESGACGEIYCHGDVLARGGGSLTTPDWGAPGSGQAACGTCHGDPPATHADDRCDACHPAGAGGHIDGALAIGSQPGCGGCHGSDANPAPPRDLRGNVLSTAIGVGAHQGHVRATARLRGPVPCSDCHPVPVSLADPGHIDTAAPAEVALAGGGSWSRAGAACESWCHGPSRPVWTRVGQGEVFCGSCHGIPPADGIVHAPDLQLVDCAGCHPATVDPFGNILRAGPPGAETSQHMDGDVDL